MIRRTFFSVAAVAVACLALGVDAKAAQINGSMSINGGSPTLIGGTDLGSATSLTFNGGAVGSVQVNAALGDYSTVPPFTLYTSNTLNFANLSGFTISNATFGSFTSVLTSGIFTSQVLSKTANFADVFLIGTYTPLPGLGANLDPTLTSLRISLNQSGNSVSAAITLNSPPVPPTVVPEPSTIASLGVALLGLAGLRRFRRRSA